MGRRAIVVFFFFVMSMSARMTFAQPIDESSTHFRPLRSGTDRLSALSMRCVEMEHEKGSEYPFFGFSYQVCADKQGKWGIYITGFSFLKSESPAYNSGLEVGDQIVEFCGCGIGSSAEYLRRRLQGFTAGNTANIGILRKSDRRNFLVITEEVSRKPNHKVGNCKDIGLWTVR